MNFDWVKRFFHSQLFRYFLAGVSVTIVNIGTYSLLLNLGLEYTSANLIALLLSKSWGFISNKLFVFRSRTDTRDTLRELISFIFARGFTALIDFFGLILFVEQFHADEHISKYIITAIVIILNFILGKFVFDDGFKSKQKNV